MLAYVSMELQVFLDYKADESYTPNKLSIRAGTAVNDLRVRCKGHMMASPLYGCRDIFLLSHLSRKASLVRG